MLLMQQHQDGVRLRLLTIGIPHHLIRPIVEDMVKWESHSGPEWTIQRLKSLKIDLFRIRVDLPTLTWLRKNSSGRWYGHWGSLFSWAERSERNFKKCVQVLMAYTYYILPALTKSQEKKFLSGILTQEKEDFSQEWKESFSKSVSYAIRRRHLDYQVQPLVTFSGSPEKKAPVPWGKSVAQNERVLDDIKILSSGSGQYLLQKYSSLMNPLLKGFPEARDTISPDDYSSEYSISGPLKCGEIHFLQEPGGKLRSVASPYRMYQALLTPLAKTLFGILRYLPWDCTFDQSKAFPFVQEHLNQGREVHSVDLSSATDHFPLSLQMVALRAIVHRDDWIHLDLFEEVSRGIWKSPLGDLRWRKGQPLGLYPSFAAFALTHGLILYHLNGCKHYNQFFVVGDDVVILNHDLAEKYYRFLDSARCPWSRDKSLSSSKLSEFAGKVITPIGVYPQLKWRRMSDDSFLDLCRLLGPRSRCLLTKRQKRVFDCVAHLCDPIGLNFSYPGSNLEKMIESTLNFYRPEEVVLGSLMGLRRRIQTFLYSSSTTSSCDELEEIAATFDEKVKLVMCQTIFSRWESSISIGLEGLDTLPQALDLTVTRLPLREKLPSRVTTLERYERIIDS